MKQIGTIPFRCPKCGGEEFVSSGQEKMDPTDTATCTGCGHQLTAAEATELANKAFQDAMKRTYGDRFKKP